MIGLLDPASREFERARRRHGRPHPQRGRTFRGGAVMGPGIPGGSRQATSQELAAMSAQVGRRRGRYETVLTQVLAEHGEQLRRTAREVLANGRTRMPFPAVTLDAELLNFWHGDRVLRIERTTRDGARGSSLARFPRHDRPDSEEIIAHYLAASLANERTNEAGGPAAGPTKPSDA
jgi:hypothetical protein